MSFFAISVPTYLDETPSLWFNVFSLTYMVWFVVNAGARGCWKRNEYIGSNMRRLHYHDTKLLVSGITCVGLTRHALHSPLINGRCGCATFTHYIYIVSMYCTHSTYLKDTTRKEIQNSFSEKVKGTTYKLFYIVWSYFTVSSVFSVVVEFINITTKKKTKFKNLW